MHKRNKHSTMNRIVYNTYPKDKTPTTHSSNHNRTFSSVQITSSRAAARAHCPVSVRNGCDIDSYALLGRPARRTHAPRSHLHTWLHVATQPNCGARRLHLHTFMCLSAQWTTCWSELFFWRCFTLCNHSRNISHQALLWLTWYSK